MVDGGRGEGGLHYSYAYQRAQKAADAVPEVWGHRRNRRDHLRGTLHRLLHRDGGDGGEGNGGETRPRVGEMETRYGSCSTGSGGQKVSVLWLVVFIVGWACVGCMVAFVLGGIAGGTIERERAARAAETHLDGIRRDRPTRPPWEGSE